MSQQLRQFRATLRALGLAGAAATAGSAFLPWLEWHEGTNNVIVGNNAFHLLHIVSHQNSDNSVTRYFSWHPWYHNSGWLVVISGVLTAIAISTPQGRGHRYVFGYSRALVMAAGIALAIYESLTAYSFQGAVGVYSTVGSGERLCLVGAIISGCAFLVEFAKGSGHTITSGLPEGIFSGTNSQPQEMTTEPGGNSHHFNLRRSEINTRQLTSLEIDTTTMPSTF